MRKPAVNWVMEEIIGKHHKRVFDDIVLNWNGTTVAERHLIVI